MAQSKRKQNASSHARRPAAGSAGRGSGGKRDVRESARELLAQQRRRESRRRAFIGAGIALLVVLIAVGVLVGLKVSGGGNNNAAPSPGTTASSAPSALISKVTGVPAATLDTVGKGSGVTPPTAESGQPVATANGKPLVFYYGAEFCPYCAAERWPLIVALSRFGTFSGLSTINSSEDNVPTFTFSGSTYTSNYITFSPKEVEDQQGRPLDSLTTQETGIVNTFDTQKSFPFVSFGNQAIISNASYTNTLLIGKTHDQIATAMQDPNSDIAKAINGTANAMTAEICKLTNNQPANVCSSAAVKAWG